MSSETAPYMGHYSIPVWMLLRCAFVPGFLAIFCPYNNSEVVSADLPVMQLHAAMAVCELNYMVVLSQAISIISILTSYIVCFELGLHH